jgi:hypothetical protein
MTTSEKMQRLLDLPNNPKLEFMCCENNNGYVAIFRITWEDQSKDVFMTYDHTFTEDGKVDTTFGQSTIDDAVDVIFEKVSAGVQQRIQRHKDTVVAFSRVIDRMGDGK